MYSQNPTRLYRAIFLGVIVCSLLNLPQIARAEADEPMLAIRLTDGESVIYAVSEIERIGFEGDETLVVLTQSGAESYSAESIRRIDFLFEFSGVDNPGGAAALVKAIHLFQNQPNPFSPETRIGFDLPQGGKVELGIYSPEGRLVRRLLTGEREAGSHTVLWDGLDDESRAVPGGVYFYSLRAPGIEESRRMILLP